MAAREIVISENDELLRRYQPPRGLPEGVPGVENVRPSVNPKFQSGLFFIHYEDLVGKVDLQVLEKSLVKDFYVCLEMDYNALPKSRHRTFVDDQGNSVTYETSHNWHPQIVRPFWINMDHGVALFPKHVSVNGKKKIMFDQFLETKNFDIMEKAFTEAEFPTKSEAEDWLLIALMLPLDRSMKGPCELHFFLNVRFTPSCRSESFIPRRSSSSIELKERKQRNSSHDK